ncbi:UNVERIFIED_CONTAM: hypothetical protein FKN15_014845 [Acipenser sinensis]
MVGDDDEGAVSDSESNEAIAADDLAQKLAAAEGKDPKIFMREEEESSEEEDEELSPEEEAKKNEFEMKRKMHYNEGMNIKLARQLIATELQEDEEEEEEEDYRDEEMKDETEDINIDPPQGDKTKYNIQRNQQFKLNMVTVAFEECLKDSPRFRAAIEEVEGDVSELESKLDKVSPKCQGPDKQYRTGLAAIEEVEGDVSELESKLDKVSPKCQGPDKQYRTGLWAGDTVSGSVQVLSLL